MSNAAADEVELARVGLYTLLAVLLARPPDQDLLARVGSLSLPPSPVGEVVQQLAARARASTATSAEREYNALFIGVERGELVPYASYYLTGFLNDRPLARLRQEMRTLGIERRPGVAEPEDHIATICEIMAGLIRGELAGTEGGSRERGFFEGYLAPWAGRFFQDLESARAADLYRPLGTLGRLFMTIEEQAFAMTAPIEPESAVMGAGR
ncbi:TorD/DmsD family molecular chaperone [Benzoatithermus flavus]|uniref:Molecular chaperone TorD family protein n=1 Tax=Benzoatithermus flavus TaxID=3108223 RepID=A0ABU8XSX6_9PROT